MHLNEFAGFLDEIVDNIKEILSSKSADYSDTVDKLYNFKLQARIDSVTPIEALRGNWRKHLGSIIQGLDELQKGKVRSEQWWREKCVDSINYQILLLALLKEEYFDK